VYHQLDVIYAHVQNTNKGRSPLVVNQQPAPPHQSNARQPSVAASSGNEGVLRSLYQNVLLSIWRLFTCLFGLFGLFVCLFVWLFVWLVVCLDGCLVVWLFGSLFLFVCLFVCDSH
jgi:uncharacterized membrane protein